LSVESNKRRLRVVAADNNKPMLDQVVSMLGVDFEVAGTAGDGIAALEMIELLQPQIAVLDISMPNMTGIEVAAELKKKGSDVKVVILTIHDDPDYVRAAIDAGAMGYVLKSHMADDLKPALLSVKDSDVYISPSCVMTSGRLEDNHITSMPYSEPPHRRF